MDLRTEEDREALCRDLLSRMADALEDWGAAQGQQDLVVTGEIAADACLHHLASLLAYNDLLERGVRPETIRDIFRRAIQGDVMDGDVPYLDRFRRVAESAMQKLMAAL